MSETTLSGRTAVLIDDDRELAALIALAGLPHLAPRRLWSLIELGTPSAVWKRVAAGGAPRRRRDKDPSDAWPAWCASIDPELELLRHRQGAVTVSPYGSHGYPEALLDDPEPPAVIFRRGSGLPDDRVRIAVVGTRQCTPYGRRIAHHLGAELARRGVDVVSGLASGIDAAAHAGAITVDPTRTVAVVAGGVDVVYPAHNRGLYHRIGSDGSLISEWPMRARPSPWRFPARNRLVAALTAAVIVVESAARGGSMYTVDEAVNRNRAVFAVPGSIHSPVSAGTNKLIADGAHALHDIDELLDTLAPQGSGERRDGGRPAASRSAVGGVAIESWLFDAVGWEPAALDTIVTETGRSPGEVTLEVERLIARGALRRCGAMVERT